MAGNDWNRERSDLNKADICLSLGNDRMDCGAQLPSRRHREQGIYPAQRAGVKNTLGLHDRITVKQAGRQARKYSLLHRSAQRTFLQRKLSRPMPVPEQPAPPQRYFRSAENSWGTPPPDLSSRPESQCFLKNCTSRSCCFACFSVEKVPRFRRFPVDASFFRE